MTIYGREPVASVALLHNANRKRATCTASGDEEGRREKRDGYCFTLNARDVARAANAE